MFQEFGWPEWPGRLFNTLQGRRWEQMVGKDCHAATIRWVLIPQGCQPASFCRPHAYPQEAYSMPTDEQLRTYAQSVPAIYREILAAFPRIEPNRRQGYGLAFQTFAADFENQGLNFNLSEIIQACQELERNGLVEIKNRIFVHPTSLGERLVTLISGRQAAAVKVEPLPAPPT
jgi:hypothetical protein